MKPEHVINQFMTFTINSLRLQRRQLRPFHLLLAGCLFFSMVPATHGFISLHHAQREELDELLITKVHAPHWTIHYSFRENCGPVDEETEKKYTQIVTVFIQSWLQPLREYTDRPIVNDFRYKRNADWRGADFAIDVICEAGRSWAVAHPPLGIQHRLAQLELTWIWMTALHHELGHLFGLADTYLPVEDWGKPGLDTGAFDHSRGSQPSSIMVSATLRSQFIRRDGGFDVHALVPLQGIVPMYTDDRNGIIWLYKHVHEGLPLRECFFPNYKLEETPLGCIPKYPLIFELKHSDEVSALLLIKGDEGLDVNAQDAEGLTALHRAVSYDFARVVGQLIQRADLKLNTQDAEGRTALHYAVLNGYARFVEALIQRDNIKLNTQDKDGRTALYYAVRNELDKIVKTLLAHEDILPFLRDTHGRSPLQIARENKLDRMITLLLEHPLTLPVNAKGKLTTTWGHLKKRY